MLSAKLRYFDAHIAAVDDSLFDTFDLIAHYDGIFARGVETEVLHLDTIVRLLDAAYNIALAAKVGNSFESGIVMLPFHRVFGAEGGLMNLLRRGTGSYATKDETLDEERVACAEDRTDIVEAADIIEHDDDWRLARCLKFLDGLATHLINLEFDVISHNGCKGTKKIVPRKRYLSAEERQI